MKYGYDANMIFLHAPNSQCLGAALISYETIGTELIPYTEREHPEIEVEITKFHIHAINWHSSVQIENNDVKKRFLISFVSRYLRHHGQIGIFIFSYNSTVSEDNISLLESHFNVCSGRAIIDITSPSEDY